MRIPRIKVRIDWQNVHFCKTDKVKYRKHLSALVILTTIIAIIGAQTGHVGLTHAASLVNAITALMWIWE